MPNKKRSGCIHLLDTDRMPLTRCGVDTNEKKGAQWSVDADEVTCNNCRKLMEGGQMGAPPPASGGQPVYTDEQLEQWALEDKTAKVDRARTRLTAIMTDIKGLKSVEGDEDLTLELSTAWEYMECAEARLNIASAILNYKSRKGECNEG